MWFIRKSIKKNISIDWVVAVGFSLDRAMNKRNTSTNGHRSLRTRNNSKSNPFHSWQLLSTYNPPDYQGRSSFRPCGEKEWKRNLWLLAHSQVCWKIVSLYVWRVTEGVREKVQNWSRTTISTNLQLYTASVLCPLPFLSSTIADFNFFRHHSRTMRVQLTNSWSLSLSEYKFGCEKTLLILTLYRKYIFNW